MMQPRYDWQKGQDAWDVGEDFGQEGRRVQDGRVQDPPLRRWRVLLAVVLIIGLIGASVFWFLNRRAGTNTAAVEDDILRANSLIFQAVASGDVELLRSNLSGRDPGWVGVQAHALLNGRVYQRPWWGLNYQPGSPDNSEIEIVLNPEWNSAEVVIPFTYQYSAPNGLTRTIQLEQTLVYRRSRERWLLAPADVGFWGERLLFEGRYLTVDYPARDGEIVARLAGDLDELVGDLCGAIDGAGCPADFRVEARFYEDSPDISGFSGSVRQLPCARGGFYLPPPTLVGLPVDGAGYEALLQGYRAEIAAVALTGLIYGPDCPVSPMANVVLDYRLSEMGFRPWPMTVSDYGRLVRDGVHLEQAAYYVGNDVSGRVSSGLLDSERPVYALVEFLAEVYGTPLGEMEAYIERGRLSRNLYWSTLHNWTDGNFADDGPLEAAWERFLVEKAGVDAALEAPELPDQDLRMVCYGGNITTGIAYPNGVLYELDVETGEMTAVFPLNHTDAYMVSLPGGDGAIVAEQRLDFMMHDAQVLLWGEDEPVVLFETIDNLLPVSTYEAGDGEAQLLVYSRRDRLYGVVSVENCEMGGSCDRSPLPGFPLWSPSRDRFLSLLAMGNHGYEGRFFRPFSMGRLTTYSDSLMGKSPFWLSDERIGFIVENGRAVTALTVAGADYPERREVLFTLEELDPLLALDEEAVIESVLSRPNEPEDLIVTVADGEGGVSIYQVNILRRWVQRLKERAFWLEPEVVYNFDLSPGGRWLVVSGEDYLIDSTAYVHLFEMAGGGRSDAGRVHSFDYKMVFERPMHWTMDWSAGDEWLAIPDNGYIRLIHPAADYQDVIVPDGVGCSGAVWVD